MRAKTFEAANLELSSSAHRLSRQDDNIPGIGWYQKTS